MTDARSLGGNFTSTLNWRIHTKQVVKHLAESLLFPHFDYAAPVYHLDKTRVLKLEKALKACVRFVVGNIPRRDHVTLHRLALGWLSAARRRQYFVGLQSFKVVANAYPSYLVDRFAYRLHVDLELRRSNRRPPQPFEPPLRRTEAFKHSFALEALDLLNSINFTSFTPAHLPLLKRTLRNALFSRDVADWNALVRNEGLPKLPKLGHIA